MENLTCDIKFSTLTPNTTHLGIVYAKGLIYSNFQGVKLRVVKIRLTIGKADPQISPVLCV